MRTPIQLLVFLGNNSVIGFHIDQCMHALLHQFASIILVYLANKRSLNIIF